MKVDIITNIGPHYRKDLWLSLLATEGPRVSIFFGQNFSSSIKQIELQDKEWQRHIPQLHVVQNLYLRGVLIWQRGVIWRALTTKADTLIFLAQIYILSNWLAAVVARARGKKVYFWGHGAYGRERRIKAKFMNIFLRIANGILVYGHHGKKALCSLGLSPARMHVVYNSYSAPTTTQARKESIIRNFFSSQGWFDRPDYPVLIFIGRLTKQKMLHALIDAVTNLAEQGIPVNVLLVGDGPERRRLEQAASSIKGQSYFYGPCYDAQTISKLLANADLCVSPGEIGLTAIHALDYGTPCLTHSDMTRQMPEAEAIKDGLTGMKYDPSETALSDAIITWFKYGPRREVARRFCYEEVDSKWTAHVHANAILKSINAIT